MSEKRTKVLGALRDTLRFHEAMGIDHYPDNENLQRFLKPVDKPSTGFDRQHGTISDDRAASQGIENLADEVNACTICQLSKESHGRVHGKGKVGSRLMIVGDWSSQSGPFSPGTLFGNDEDVMLWKMIVAIELQTDQVYVTNSLKCCPENSESIDAKCEESCFSYLAREIAAVTPHVICAMGEMAVRVLMGTKEPLARLRGRFGSYRYQSGETVMVMPTFHPRFLLQHQDMKKATWNDLLAIKRLLAES